MGIKDKILSGLAVVGGIFSAIFYVLFKQAKDERRVIEEAYQRTKEKAEAQGHVIETQQAATTAGIKVQKENEEKIQQAHSGNNLDVFNACNELLSKQ